MIFKARAKQIYGKTAVHKLYFLFRLGALLKLFEGFERVVDADRGFAWQVE